MYRPLWPAKTLRLEKEWIQADPPKWRQQEWRKKPTVNLLSTPWLVESLPSVKPELVGGWRGGFHASRRYKGAVEFQLPVRVRVGKKNLCKLLLFLMLWHIECTSYIKCKERHHRESTWLQQHCSWFMFWVQGCLTYQDYLRLEIITSSYLWQWSTIAAIVIATIASTLMTCKELKTNIAN